MRRSLLSLPELMVPEEQFLEGIYYLGTGYSFRQARDENLVRFGSVILRSVELSAMQVWTIKLMLFIKEKEKKNN